MRERVRHAISNYTPIEMDLGTQREAAVLLLLHQRDGVEHVLFQVRSSTVAHHGGQISLPGGARDPGDATLLDTALREVEEEIGVPRTEVEIFGRLDDSYARSSNYRIRPFVGALEVRPRRFTVDEGEVFELIEVPLPHLLSPDGRGWYAVDDGRGAEPSPAFVYGDYIIWGATWRIFNQFTEVLERYA